jgi:hypothetical protein
VLAHALEVVRDAVPEFQMVVPEQISQLYERLLLDLAAKQQPERRLRLNPRVVKRKMSNFKLKRAEPQRPPKLQGSIRFAIVIQWQPNARADELEVTTQAVSHQEGSLI